MFCVFWRNRLGSQFLHRLVHRELAEPSKVELPFDGRDLRGPADLHAHLQSSGLPELTAGLFLSVTSTFLLQAAARDWAGV